MKEKVLIKKNVFTCVMFGAVFIFVVFASCVTNINLSMIAFFIAIPIFFLSIIKLIVDILEDINDKMTFFLKEIENGQNDVINWGILQKIWNANYKDVPQIIEEYCGEEENKNWYKLRLQKYHTVRVARVHIRRFRRFFCTYIIVYLWCY